MGYDRSRATGTGATVLIGLIGFIAGVAVAISASSSAQPYIGGSVGVSHEDGIGNQPDHGSHDGCASAGGSQNRPVGTLFAGYRSGQLGLEVGAGNLFRIHYAVDCPWNLGSQDVQASYRYVRMNGYFPLPHGFEFVPFVGVAAVKYTNFEVGNYRAPYLTPEHVTNLTTGKQYSPLVGVGVEKKLDSWFLRGEFQYVGRVAEDYWTARGWHNSVQTISIGIGRYI